LKSLPNTETLFIEAAFEEDHADSDLGIDVGPDQLAYIYFTSGSTGEPKGAMCEHAGMLNHLFGKIEDLGLARGRWWPRPRRSVSTFRCGSWFLLCWSVAERC
jgi:non-ribosomal peptide synthetase component F